MTYSELVQRVLACRLADMEMGLARSREQKVFVEQISRVLDKACWDYTVRMSADFKVTFNVEFAEPFAAQVQALEVALMAYCEVQTTWASGLPTVHLSSRRADEDGIGCKLVFGDVA